MEPFLEQWTFFSFQQEVLLCVDIVYLQKKPVYMLPYLVLDLIVLAISVPVIFIAGIIGTVNNWVFGLIALVIGSALICKYYYQGERVGRSQCNESKS
jgi:hypothetical protein